MKLGLSNIALSPYSHLNELSKLSEMGFSGLEVAPSRVWRDTWSGLSSESIELYRRETEVAGLSIVGLHSLFYDHPDLGMFSTGDIRSQTLNYLVHLSKVCRDLGGVTLIYGGGRWRGDIPKKNAFTIAGEFITDLITRVEKHGTVFCFEPLAECDSDFINSAYESIDLVSKVNHKSFKVQLDAKALVANNELSPKVFQAAKHFLAHVHLNEPDLGILGCSGTIDNSAIAGFLKDIQYDGYVSLEQKKILEDRTFEPIEASMKILREYYL